MKEDVKKKWVEALRSDEYSQTQEILRAEDGYCCLGVLCDLYAKEVGGRWVEIDDVDKEYRFVPKDSNEEERDLPPKEVADWAGLPDREGGILEGPPIYDAGGIETVETLAEMNDAGRSFEEIANVIESRF